ncbi:MAG: protein kinase [Vicinamibacterales bacterium]
MTPELWRRAEAIFQDAVELPPDARAPFVARASGGDEALANAVHSLLDADASPGPTVGDLVAASAADWARESADLTVGRRIGPYRVTALIGEGGMGRVYRAVREGEFAQDVAIKIVKRGMDTDAIVQRFRTERQILASLDHPNIARLFDGGTTDDGLPYFVMEYIVGQPIIAACRARGLDVAGRLRLFQAVCGAVQHAHQNLVVHRDLKPSNILVTADGTAKLLDFGIAKLLDDRAGADGPRTLTEARALTPEYGSPEQVLGQPITTATDVYSLGTVLYELLTGERAHRLAAHTPAAIEDAICRTEVAPPSTVVRSDPRLSRRLAGDLDTIVGMALAKEPERRYQSVAALADDLGRHLANLPVHARPATLAYRTRKFVRRRRGLLAATAAVLVALAVGGVLVWRQAQETRARELQGRALARTFLFEVHDSLRGLPGATSARRTIVETAVQYLDALAAAVGGDDALRQELAVGYRRLGDIQGDDEQGANLGAVSEALGSYRKALAMLDALPAAATDRAEVGVERLGLWRRIATADARSRGAEKGLETYAEALAIGKSLVARHPGDVAVQQLHAEVLLEAARWRREALDYAGSLAAASEARDMLARMATPAPDTQRSLALADSESAMGMALGRLGQLQEALAHFERAVAIGERLLEADPRHVNHRRNLMIGYSHIGDVMGFPGTANLGDLAGAEKAYARMAALGQELYQADPDDRRAAADYAIALMRVGVATPVERSAERLARLEQSLAVTNVLVVAEPDPALAANGAYVLLQIGDTHRDLDRPDAALDAYGRAIAMAEPVAATNASAGSSMAVAVAQAALLHARAGRAERALALAEQAHAMARDVVARHTDPAALGRRYALPRAYATLADVHEHLGRRDQAESWRAKARVAWRELEGTQGFTEQFAREARALEAVRP